MPLEPELECARQAAEEAGRLQLERRDARLMVCRKGDRSPVTDVDRACESRIREILLGRFPDDGFLGEESGELPGTSGRRWIVDPLDGTRPYIRGIPTHSALVALEDPGGIAVGVACLPALGETYWAGRGCGAFRNGEGVHVSHTDTLDACMGSALGFVEFAGSPCGRNLLRLMGSWDYSYGFMDVYSYMCLASGRLDACVNLLDRSWDCAAAACIVREAGGRFSDVEGNETVHSGNIVLSNGLLHEQLLNFLAQ